MMLLPNLAKGSAGASPSQILIFTKSSISGGVKHSNVQRVLPLQKVFRLSVEDPDSQPAISCVI